MQSPPTHPLLAVTLTDALIQSDFTGHLRYTFFTRHFFMHSLGIIPTPLMLLVAGALPEIVAFILSAHFKNGKHTA